MDEIFLTPQQAAEVLNLSAYTVRAYARQGIIPAHKVGRTWRFSRADLEEWVMGSRRESSLAYPLVARDASSAQQGEVLSGMESLEIPSSYRPMTREQAVDTLRAIRARARQGNVLSLVRESRRELEQRGQITSDPKRPEK